MLSSPAIENIFNLYILRVSIFLITVIFRCQQIFFKETQALSHPYLNVRMQMHVCARVLGLSERESEREVGCVCVKSGVWNRSCPNLQMAEDSL